MPPERVTFFMAQVSIKPGPPPDHRAAPVRTYDPACAKRLVVHKKDVAVETSHHRSPQKTHASSVGMLHHDAMQIRATYAHGSAVGEHRLCRQTGTHKTNPAEAVTFDGRNAHAQALKGGDPVGH